MSPNASTLILWTVAEAPTALAPTRAGPARQVQSVHPKAVQVPITTEFKLCHTLFVITWALSRGHHPLLLPAPAMLP